MLFIRVLATAAMSDLGTLPERTTSIAMETQSAGKSGLHIHTNKSRHTTSKSECIGV